MIGAYVTFVVQQVIRSAAPGLFGASLIISVPLAFIVAGIIGIVIERTLIRWLYGRPLETLLATWGLSLVLQQAVRSIFGANNRDVGTPDWMSGATAVGRPDHHFQPALHHHLRGHGTGGADGVAALHLAWPVDARGDAEPADGGGDGHPHTVDRRVDLRSGLRRRRHGGRGA